MKICILNDACYENSESPTNEYDVPSDLSPYLQGHRCEMVFIQKATAVKQLIKLAQEGFDVFVNLCDGAWDEDRPGIEVVQALERLGLAFTGAGSSFYEPSRQAMKRMCHAWGINTPACVFAADSGSIESAALTLRFPLIVKHPSSYSSVGLTRASRVESAEDLRRESRKMIEAFGGALIEEFIEGREFTVLVVENPNDLYNPTVYAPVEFCFPEGESFKHFDLKWVDYRNMSCIPCNDPEIAERLEGISKKLFVGLNGSGYGRCDIRMDGDGELYMLEINPNCGVFYPEESPGSADFILLNDPAGHKGFVERIIKVALRRKQKQNKNWEARADREGNYGMFATEIIGEGEVIEVYEEQPHVLVSKTHVMRHWSLLERLWFERYAYPITDEIWITWSRNPENWKPINHSCDPNSWLDGLNLVARREISRDEEITMDYATFYNETAPGFACSCGSPDCRKVVRGTDYLENFVERYVPHVSDYVRMKRRYGSKV